MTKTKNKVWLMALTAVVCVFVAVSFLAGCKTTTMTAVETAVVSETTSTVTTAASESTAAASETTTAASETTTAASESTAAAGTTVPETTAAAETTAAVVFTNEKLSITGSNTLLEVSQLWVEEFMAKFGGQISLSGAGSGVGIADMINKTNDLANSSRTMKASEVDKAKAAGVAVQEFKVLIDGICIVASKNINITELTLNQLADIYAGNITNWNQVGGPDASILAIARDSSSGTGEFFLQKVVQLNQTNTNDYSPNALRLASNAEILNQIESGDNAIGYIGMGYLQDAGSKVNLIKVKFSATTPAIAPTVQAVTDFTYPISRYCYIYANGNKLSAIAKAYLDFVLSADGQNIVEQAGFVKVK